MSPNARDMAMSPEGTRLGKETTRRETFGRFSEVDSHKSVGRPETGSEKSPSKSRTL